MQTTIALFPKLLVGKRASEKLCWFTCEKRGSEFWNGLRRKARAERLVWAEID